MLRSLYKPCGAFSLNHHFLSDGMDMVRSRAKSLDCGDVRGPMENSSGRHGTG